MDLVFGPAFSRPTASPRISSEKTSHMKNIVSVPLLIASRETNQPIKKSSAQVRAAFDPEPDRLTLIAACEEGIFETQLSPRQLQQAKAKESLEPETWQCIVFRLLGLEPPTGSPAPGPQALVFSARLATDDSYDPDTGELLAPCGDSLPEFELSITTQDVLSILYGRLVLPFKDVDQAPPSERAQYNLLTWILEAALWNKQLRADVRQTHALLEQQKSMCGCLEDEILQMTSDYKAILRDLENRFFQVLNEKRRRIAELEPASAGDLELLNLEYVKRNSTNLNRVHVEDIVGKAVVPSKRSRARKRPRKNGADAAEQVATMELILAVGMDNVERGKMERDLMDLDKMERDPIKMDPVMDPLKIDNVGLLPTNPEPKSNPLIKLEFSQFDAELPANNNLPSDPSRTRGDTEDGCNSEPADSMRLEFHAETPAPAPELERLFGLKTPSIHAESGAKPGARDAPSPRHDVLSASTHYTLRPHHSQLGLEETDKVPRDKGSHGPPGHVMPSYASSARAASASEDSGSETQYSE